METQSYREDTRSCNCAAFLLMNSTQKDMITEVLGFKCHEVIIINELVKKVKKSLQKKITNCSCKKGYKYLVIDTQNMPQKLELKYLLEQIGPQYAQIANQDDQDTTNKLDIVVFWVENNGQNAPELLKEEIGDANIQIVQKPVNAVEIKAVFMDPSFA